MSREYEVCTPPFHPSPGSEHANHEVEGIVYFLVYQGLVPEANRATERLTNGTRETASAQIVADRDSVEILHRWAHVLAAWRRFCVQHHVHRWQHAGVPLELVLMPETLTPASSPEPTPPSSPDSMSWALLSREPSPQRSPPSSQWLEEELARPTPQQSSPPPANRMVWAIAGEPHIYETRASLAERFIAMQGRHLTIYGSRNRRKLTAWMTGKPYIRRLEDPPSSDEDERA
ncbi:hypothetical protein GGX14DRAFT_389349 [Mycena pura]|uniref:Uncharacterized protein n=1 Tax=Mycena pura TaxID=153505 RepID=A0AAD6VQC2_9AGAR|nr:hypothetical protein GGX14DRAFT_389349 [Mycena pura]